MAFEIGGRRIGISEPVFVIAEIGLNHGGDPERALALVDAAAQAGASAVKLQTIDACGLVAPHCPPPAHVAAQSLREFFAQFELDLDAHRAVVQRARRHGLAVLTTPFSERAVPALETLDLDAYKVASGDLTYDGLITALARTGRPLVISTGMSDLSEVLRALHVARVAGARHVALLHCVSAYPTPPDAQNLRAVATLRDATGVPAGLSDHGAGLEAAVLAAALGACIYERHLVLDGDTTAIDSAVSSTPAELERIVKALARTQAALGDGVKRCLPIERPNVVPSRRGLYAARAIRASERIDAQDVTVLRPAAALTPADAAWVVGSTARRDIAAGEAFARADLSTHSLLPSANGSGDIRIVPEVVAASRDRGRADVEVRFA